MISFIVPAHNEAAELGGCLAAIEAAAQDCGLSRERGWECIVADDASTDDTAAIAAGHDARVVAVNHRNIAATRNDGAVSARGDVLVFVDADTRLNPAVLSGALAALEDGAVGGGAGVRFDEPLPRWAKVVIPPLVAAYRTTGWAAGCFVYCRRDAFERVGGFDARYYGSEEIHLSRALKRQGRFVVLRDKVLTSGRKFRLHGPWRMLWGALRILLRGPAALKRREGLEIWYDGQRESGRRE